MAKDGEIEYPNKIGKNGREHALNKPFSDSACGQYLIDMGSLLNLLPAPPGKLLDVGAGTGWTSVFFAKRGYDVTVQDISKDMISLAQTNKDRYNLQNIDFVNNDFEKMELNESYNYVIFYDSLHHSINEYKAISSAYKSLKPGGLCVTVEPGIGHSISIEAKNAVKKWGVTERDMPPSQIIKAGKKAGFRKCKVYLRFYGPFEILSYSTLTGLISLCKNILKIFPYFGIRKSNIVVMKK